MEFKIGDLVRRTKTLGVVLDVDGNDRIRVWRLDVNKVYWEDFWCWDAVE